jgi:DNA (cytosine-5)-methyltransferase 1
MVWENVPGAFSSNKGEDFRIVLEETARVADKTAVIPGPPKGKWSNSGCILGNGWSIAWRVHDAQFWGVPQRRRRVALVADFGGETAPEILFERKSVSGDIEESGQERETAAVGAADSAGETSEFINGVEDFINAVNKDAKHQQDLIQSDLGVARALAAGTHGASPHLTKTLITSYQDRCEKDGGGYVPMVAINGDIAGTLDANYYKGCGERQGTEREVVCVGNGQMCNITMQPIANSLDCMHDQQAIITYQAGTGDKGERNE